MQLPSSSFGKGCIWSAMKGSVDLITRLKFGRKKKRRYQAEWEKNLQSSLQDWACVKVFTPCLYWLTRYLTKSNLKGEKRIDFSAWCESTVDHGREGQDAGVWDRLSHYPWDRLSHYPHSQKANEVKSVALQGFFFFPIYLVWVPDPMMVSCRVDPPSSRCTSLERRSKI